MRRRSPHTPTPVLTAQDAPWSLIGPGSLVHGELLMCGNVVVHGRLEGILFTDGEILIAEGGSVEGGVQATRVQVEGSCQGRIEGAEEVILKPGAVVRGEIETPVLTLDPGARFLGDWSRPGSTGGPKILPYKTPSPGSA